jgi:hypothetical protein
VERGEISARTIVTGKGQAGSASCKGALCSAFGVESVSSDVDIRHTIHISADPRSPEIMLLAQNRKPIYLLVDQRMTMTKRQGGRTTTSAETFRRKGAVACAHEPYVFVLRPESGYDEKLDGTADVTIKRTYAPGSSVKSFEITNVNDAQSRILKASLRPIQAECYHPAFKSYRP